MLSAQSRTRFLGRLAPSSREAFEREVDLDARLSTMIAEARAANPEVALDETSFVVEIAARVSEEGTPLEELAALRAADLHLAAACARGDDAAIAAFDRLYGPELDRAIAKSPRLGLTKDEFRQLVRAKLFVAEGGKAPRITSYSGRGALKSWVRVTAARVVVDLARAHEGRDQPSDQAMLDRIPGRANPELAYLRHAHASHVPEAFELALQKLTVRQRNLLRQRYLHGLGADKLVPLYGVHRATVFGWIDDARKALLVNLRDALARRVPGTELESIVDLLGSELDLSVRRLLDSKLEDDR